uniref:Uncharacterized protein n=1 Tax=Avena sativa TaxID=4498 RepID=A0ACD5Z556_AVESA
MDPIGSFASEEDYICHLSPLHEMLRGTTAMLTLEQFHQKFDNPKPISTPFRAPILPYNSSLVAPAASSKSPFVANSTALSTIQESTLDIADYGVFDPSMDSTSSFVGKFMAPSSQIQENPLPTMDASRKSYGVFNPLPATKNPEWLVYGEQKQKQKPNTILRPSHYEELRGMVRPGVSAAHVSTQAPPGIQQTVRGVLDATYPGVPERGLPEYRCRRCEISFYNSQAYGGHMSSHSKKARTKILLD